VPTPIVCRLDVAAIAGKLRRTDGPHLHEDFPPKFLRFREPAMMRKRIRDYIRKQPWIRRSGSEEKQFPLINPTVRREQFHCGKPLR
jgi:hypothetical protein